MAWVVMAEAMAVARVVELVEAMAADAVAATEAVKEKGKAVERTVGVVGVEGSGQVRAEALPAAVTMVDAAEEEAIVEAEKPAEIAVVATAGVVTDVVAVVAGLEDGTRVPHRGMRQDTSAAAT